MGYEYKISCSPVGKASLAQLIPELPSPIDSEGRQIYDYQVEDDGYYFVDHLVDRVRSASALLALLDAALSIDQKVVVSEP